MPPVLRSLLYFLLFVASSLNAETVKDVAQRAHLANINALLIFTSQDGLSTGRYRFTDVGVTMELYNLPFTYHFKPKQKKYNYFVVGNVGYSRTFVSADTEIPPNVRLNFDNHLRTYTAGLGGGMRYKPAEDVHLSAGGELIYSRSGVSVNGTGDDLSDAISDFFSENYNENISYKLFVLGEYRPVVQDYKPYVSLGYKLYETKSGFSLNEIGSFSTDSSVTSLALGVETPKLYKRDRHFLTFEVYTKAHYLTGDVVRSVDFNTYGMLGAVLYWYTPESPSWAERFFFEVSSVRSDSLEGYNVGVGFTVDF